MVQEDELQEEEEGEVSGVDKQSEDVGQSSEQQGLVPRRKTELPRDQRQYLRCMNVKRKKDFICLERVSGKMVNILKGLELHSGVFSAVDQKRIVDFIGELQVKGKKGELKERTFTAPRKWMRGKGRETIQFGCCYSYATHGNPPGILRDNVVDPANQQIAKPPAAVKYDLHDQLHITRGGHLIWIGFKAFLLGHSRV